MSIKIGDRVIVGHSDAYNNVFYNRLGCVRNVYPKTRSKNLSIGVKIDGHNHPINRDGLYWFPEQDLIIVIKNVYPEPRKCRDDSLIPSSVAKAMINRSYGIPHNPFEIKTVHFSGPCTVVMWADGTKTVVRCNKDDFYTSETGLAMAIAKRAYGNGNKARKVFEKWLPKEDTAINDSIALGFKKAIAALDRLSGALKETEEPDNE